MTSSDRPAAIRRALRDLVAERGFHGASMASVAKRAGVATGTAYVHYSSKEEVVFATYLEIKSDLAEAVLEGYREDAESKRTLATRPREVLRASRKPSRSAPGF